MESCSSLRKFFIVSKGTAALFLKGLDSMTSLMNQTKGKCGKQLMNV